MNQDYLSTTIDSYNQNVERYIQSTAGMIMNKEIDTFISHLPSEGKILDAGCAWGRDSQIFAEKGFSVTGIDLSEGLLKKATERVPAARFLKMDLRNLDFPDNSFDGIWACASLLHLTLPDIEKALLDFYQILRPGGYLFVWMKKGGSDKKLTESYTNPGERHFSYVESEELTRLVEKAGFAIDQSYMVNERERFGQDKRDLWWIGVFASK